MPRQAATSTDTSQERTPSTDTSQERTTSANPDAETTIDVKLTGHVRTAVGEPGFEYTFEGDTLREFLDQFFDDYDVQDLVLAETEDDATAPGWAPTPDELPGTWKKNPDGEQTRAYARVLVNGRFNEHNEGFDTHLDDGDRVALVYPFMFCV